MGVKQNTIPMMLLQAECNNIEDEADLQKKNAEKQQKPSLDLASSYHLAEGILTHQGNFRDTLSLFVIFFA